MAGDDGASTSGTQPPSVQDLQQQLLDQQAAMEAIDEARQQAEQAAEATEALNLALRTQLAAANLQGPPFQPGQGAGAPSWGARSVPAGGAAPPPQVNQQFAAFQAQNPGSYGQVIHAITLDIASIPSFSGESRDVSVEHFLKAFSSYVRLNKTPAAAYGDILDNRTEGLANDLVRKLHPHQLTSLEEIQRAFRQEFRTTHFTAGLDQRVANLRQMPRERVADYYSRVNHTVRELRNASERPQGVNSDGWNAVWASKAYFAFLNGLRQEMYSFVLTRNATTLEEAREAALAGEEVDARGRLFPD